MDRWTDRRTDRQTDRHMAKIKRVKCYSEPIFELRTLRGTLPILFADIFTNIEPIKDTQIADNWEKNRKTFFDFLSSGLGINVSLFRLGQFEEVESELGSPEAGVEIGTG